MLDPIMMIATILKNRYRIYITCLSKKNLQNGLYRVLYQVEFQSGRETVKPEFQVLLLIAIPDNYTLKKQFFSTFCLTG